MTTSEQSAGVVRGTTAATTMSPHVIFRTIRRALLYVALSIAAFVGKFLAASGDKRVVTADPQARYFGAALDDRGLNPGANPRVGRTRFEEWAARAGLRG